MGCECFKENKVNIYHTSKIAPVTNNNSNKKKKEESPNVSKENKIQKKKHK